MPKRSDAGDRAQSEHNVGKKKEKVARELSSLVDAGERLQFKKDLAQLAAEMEKQPHKMKHVKVVMDADVKPSQEYNRFLHPDLQGKA